MIGIRGFLKPRHTAWSVAATLIRGLENGTIILESPLEAAARINSTGVKGWNNWRNENFEVNPNLSFVDLSRTKLNRINLRMVSLHGAILYETDLRNADLVQADLSTADLRKANLRGANLNNANVVDTLFGDNLGLTWKDKEDLMSRGAIFEDSPEAPVEMEVRS